VQVCLEACVCVCVCVGWDGDLPYLPALLVCGVPTPSISSYRMMPHSCSRPQVRQAAAQPPPGSEQLSFSAPPGFAFDPTSGYFFSPEPSPMYYDPASGAYSQPGSGKWYVVDPTSGQYVER
jgi:hypothetical protein